MAIIYWTMDKWNIVVVYLGCHISIINMVGGIYGCVVFYMILKNSFEMMKERSRNVYTRLDDVYCSMSGGTTRSKMRGKA